MPISPLEVLQYLPTERLDDLTLEAAFELATDGNAVAARYIAAHPRTQVFVRWVRAYRLDKEDAKVAYAHGRAEQYVQMDFSIGTPRRDDATTWVDETGIPFDVEIDANKDRVIKWEDWGQLLDSRPSDAILPIFLGDWIKESRILTLQADEADDYLIEDDTTMPLAEFIERLKAWSHWATIQQ